MKNTLYLFGALFLLLSSCKKDEEFNFTNVINYDGENATAPFLPPGPHEAAARFTAGELSPYIGRELIEISFYMTGLPQSCEIRVYEEGNRDAPGNTIYSASVSNSLTANSWNTHVLVSPIPVSGDDLWISIRVTHGGSQQSIGCDSGPADSNGDWLLLSTEAQWQTYRAVANESINWNIRGRISEN